MTREVDSHFDPCTQSPPTTRGATIFGGLCILRCIQLQKHSDIKVYRECKLSTTLEILATIKYQHNQIMIDFYAFVIRLTSIIFENS